MGEISGNAQRGCFRGQKNVFLLLERIFMQRSPFRYEERTCIFFQVEDVEILFREAGNLVRRGFQSLPRTMAEKLSKAQGPEEVEVILASEIETILKDLSGLPERNS